MRAVRALATTALLLISLALPVAAKASDCGNAESLDQARRISKAKVASNEFSSVVEISGAELGERFLGSNHFRQPDRVYGTKCGRRDVG
jgi:hypothetical protein